MWWVRGKNVDTPTWRKKNVDTPKLSCGPWSRLQDLWHATLRQWRYVCRPSGKDGVRLRPLQEQLVPSLSEVVHFSDRLLSLAKV